MFDNIMKRLIKLYSDSDKMIIFGTRSLWYEIDIHPSIVKKRFAKFLGEERRSIRTRDEAIELLENLIKDIQHIIKIRMQETDSRLFIRQLQQMFSKVYKVYIDQKKARLEMKSMNIRDDDVIEMFEVNKQISKCLIDGISIWIENAILYQNISGDIHNHSNELDIGLFIDVYIYGVASMNFSLLHMAELKGFDAKEFYYGLDLTPNEDIPIQAYREHPVTYHNPIITGNQNNLYDDIELHNADNSLIGEKFKEKYSLSFLRYIAILHGLPEYGFKEYMTKDEFYIFINNLGIDDVNPEVIYDNLTLKKEDIATQLRDTDELIWTIETNEHRVSLKPFIKLESGDIMTTEKLIERAKHTWTSYLLNGGQIYSKNPMDDLLKAFQSRNDELANRLVNLLREILRKKYNSTIDEIEVPYSKIWGKRDINYGDFDLMFYSKEVNELFLIEAKYICDSLNSSGMVSDYDKMFRDKGYHFKCRRRYDLVIREPDKLKNYIGAEDEINVHFLFISSKPLEIELKDKDDIVTFLSLEMFDAYINGRYESEDGTRIIISTYRL
jgi:hypothetical protein